MTSAQETPTSWSTARASTVGTSVSFAVVALTNAVFIAIFVPRPHTGLWVRIQHHLFDASSTLGVGFVAAAVVGAAIGIIERGGLSNRARWLSRVCGIVAYSIFSGVLMLVLVGYELDRIALSKFGGRFHVPIYVVGAIILGLCIPSALVVGWWCARGRRLRIVALVISCGVLIANHLVLRDDYAGFHGALVWLSVSLATFPCAFVGEVLVRRLKQRTSQAIGIVLLITGGFGLVVPPSATVRVEMFREPGCITPWIFAYIFWKVPGTFRDTFSKVPGTFETPSPKSVAASQFFHPRDQISATTPTIPPLLKDRAPIVVLITIDATRADAIDRDKNEPFFPTLAKFKKEAAYFTHVTSAGSQTAVSLGALFSGRYFSQLEWRDHGAGPLRFIYPATDKTLRFPEILSNHHINTATFCSITFLSNEYGVVRGFREERMVTKGREHARADQVMTPLLERIALAGDEPLFVYAHLTEPHSPYDRGGTKGPAIQRYLREIEIADQYIGKLVDLLNRRFADRAFLFITSDHGEAFGEHGTYKHTKTLYEELLRVPLFIVGPGISARRIDQHVTLVDLGPTILDIFGIDTPSSFMGQSLVPLLAGQDKQLDRPILAEGRLRRVLYWDDLKVIDDPRRKVAEVYDLNRDPRELRNLIDSDPARSLPALAALRRFFDVHELKLEGYKPPYKQ